MNQLNIGHFTIEFIYQEWTGSVKFTDSFLFYTSRKFSKLATSVLHVLVVE